MAVIVALGLTALIGAVGLAVDVGNVFLGARRLQGMADLAAISAAQSLTNGVAGDAAVATAANAAAGTVDANSWPGAALSQTEVGLYTADRGLPASSRFQASTTNPSAARVTLRAPVRLVFAGVFTGGDTVQVSRRATAARADLAAFSIGSGLASLNGGVANALLSAFAGGQVQISAMDGQALASANVSLAGYVSAVSARLGLQGASYGRTLDSSVSAATALTALSDALRAQGETQAAGAAATLSGASGSAGVIRLSDLFDLGPYSAQDHMASAGGAVVNLGAGALANAVLVAANGQRQLAVDLGSSVPGLTSLKATLAVGQRPSRSPWIAVTDAATVIVRTAQSRIYLQAAVAPGLLGGQTGAIGVSAYAELAAAQAKLAAIACPADPSAQSADVSALPSLGELALGQVDPARFDDFTTPETIAPAVLVDTPLLQATGSALVNIGGGSGAWRQVDFSRAEIAAGAVKTVTTDDIAQATLASLFGGAALQVRTPTYALGLGQGPATAALKAGLVPAGAALDTVLDQLTRMLGVQLGRADVSVDGLRCNDAALVG